MMNRFFGTLIGLLLLAPSAATALTLTISGNGLTDTSANFACDIGPCTSNKVLTLENPVLATGTIDVNEGAGTADIDITLSTFTFVGSVAGVDEVVFTNVNYLATVDVSIVGDEIQQVGASEGSVAGNYEQLLLGGTVVADQAFATTPTFLNLDCLVPGGTGQCGLRVGLGIPSIPDFPLDVNGTVLEVVNTFNLIVVPEPSTGALLATALTFLTVARRRRAAGRN